jgi:hypothetical protein
MNLVRRDERTINERGWEGRQAQGNPKILVRGLIDVYSIPEKAVAFRFTPSLEGGFVWRDRDG